MADLMTREKFTEVLRALIIERYPWASDAEKLARFMAAVDRTLSGSAEGPYWNPDGDTTRDAWRAIGGKGRPTRKALRALPAS